MEKILFIIAVTAISIPVFLSGKSTSTEKDFSLADRKASSLSVAAIIIGTLVGGASTIGTVQLAYKFGLAAWIFTLGSGIACLLLGLFFARPLRNAETATVSEYIGLSFGKGFRKYSSIFTSAGIFIHIIAQILASASILVVVFDMSLKEASIVSAVILGIFTLSGGIKSTAAMGKIKIVILYVVILSCFLITVFKSDGFAELSSQLPKNIKWFSLFSYGQKDAALDLLSMVIGVLATQTYLQAIFSARSVSEAKKGAFLSALLIPPIGLMGVFIGMYLKVSHSELESASTAALPYFIETYFPIAVSTIFMAFVFIIIVGTGSGLTLGVITNIYRDIIPAQNKSSQLKRIRIIGVILLMLALMVVLLELNNVILEWSYLSMGIRGSAIFLPLFLCIFFKRITGNKKVRILLYAIPVAYLILNLIII
ncbi:MAG: sodium:solute symporter family protein [Flexistipes sinusarabici]|uniref:Sodium:solute symporter family protein n=1 Tax=Flexistipes sinusarabici TaxID=2352 RepID=A0A5D0MGS6_FLESI|nr:sodium:solute symporter family protein [Flexistipes sinusarabici]TYB32914.1 MAG: sodium:solute symporter family protein [Flexistipes sinusarabici]